MAEPVHDRRVVVLGGANVDVVARSSALAELGTSNPGTVTRTPGGVARNIAENLARLGSAVDLVSVVGRDAAGDWLLTQTAAAGVGIDHVTRVDAPTGGYVAVLDRSGDLVVAVSDMAATDGLRPADIQRAGPAIAAATMLVVDGNLAVDTVECALDLADQVGCRAILEPVSAPKAARLARVLAVGRPVYAVTPNRAELAALTSQDTDDDAGVDRAVASLHRLGVDLVWVRLGAAGSVLSRREHGRHVFPAMAGPVRDVTGAGDAMLAAFVDALLCGESDVVAARRGHAAAALTVAAVGTVRPDMSRTLLGSALDASVPGRVASRP